MSNANILEELLKKRQLEEQQRKQVQNSRQNRVILPVKNISQSTLVNNTLNGTSNGNDTASIATQADVNKMINSMSKVNVNYKDDTLNNIKNFNNLQYNSNQQLNNVNNARKVSMNDLKNIKSIENTVTAMNLEQEAKNTGDYYNTYKGYADKVIADMGNKIDDATNFSGALSNLGIGVKKRFNKYCW